jgi:phenylalanyl-tRNA synthetase alpha chain
MKSELEQLEKQAILEIGTAESPDKLRAIRAKYVGRKGSITAILRQLGSLPDQDRKEVGRIANRIKVAVEREAKAREAYLAGRDEEARAEPSLDVTLPGYPVPIGRLHPITQTINELVTIFARMGFEVATGPEVETDYYNFVSLNTPKDHPARDMQATFFVTEALVLRTQTSPVQVRTMEKRKPPVRIIAPGKVYRPDLDASHSPMFFQAEGFMVDEGVSFADLKGVLDSFARSFFGEQADTRFRPSFFPFTEPSAEVDVRCVICRGAGCRTCGQKGWLEIAGCGMIHPAVFDSVGYDYEKYTGFAFGVGLDRLAMLRYRVDDIRLFYENDLRFLEQF